MVDWTILSLICEKSCYNIIWNGYTGNEIARKGDYKMSETRPMSQSRTISTKLVLPPDTNHLQTIFGGKVLAYIDEIAAITAMKHSNTAVVTASIDRVDFVSSAYVGDVLELEAVVSSTGRTSMEVYVLVHSTNLLTGGKETNNGIIPHYGGDG